MTPAGMKRHVWTLQTRLMAAVIGFVSLILVIVALITSATLGTTLEARLADQLQSTAEAMTRRAATAFVNETYAKGDASDLTASSIISGVGLQGVSSFSSVLLAISSDSVSASGAINSAADGTEALTNDELQLIAAAIGAQPTTVTLPGKGAYLILAEQSNETGLVVVTGLPRAEIESTMAQLFTVIALATLGGLILLALTTMATIRVSLRPLRAVAATATRVANQPLDRGEVSITERVPSAEADPRTETGLVGAALNTLLDHVDASLSSRQRNEEMMRRFVADASHELRTPLASIRGYSELSLRALRQGEHALPARAGSEDVLAGTTSSLERIQAQSLRMTTLVEDLLLLARLDEGRELIYGSVDLSRLAIESVADARPTALDHSWSIDIPEEPVLVLGDSGRLHQVVTNLLANARTHTPAGTEVALSVSVGDGTAVLRVHDNGPGIDPAVRDQLFARFARGDSSRARQTGGTGLGLSIAKAIVDGHGGTIEVESRPGSTTFTVRLPLPPAAPTPPGEAAA